MRQIEPRRAIVIAGVTLATAVVAAHAGALSFANANRIGRPALVWQTTGDPASRLSLILEESASDPNRLKQPDTVKAVQAVLRRDPLDPAPIRMLALAADASGRSAEARRIAAVGERVTRRDMLTQLLMIEQAVGRGDSAGALVHYDRVLRTSTSARALLFPVLSGAISDPVIRRGVIGYVRARANWIPEFIFFAMRSGPAGPADVARLLLEANSWNDRSLIDANAATLIGMLTDQKQADLAAQVFRHLPTAHASLLADTSLSRDTVNPRFGTFAWYPVPGSATGGAIEAPDDGSSRTARVFATSGETGVVLRRVLRLSPGAYRIDERRKMIAGDATSQGFWRLSCLSGQGNRIVWSGPPAAAGGSNSVGPTIPDGCPTQLIEFVAAGGDAPSGVELVIERFALRRV